MVDHVDILKDGASAVYGSDAISGVVNFFLIHKFRGLEIGATYGNTNAGASNEMGEWEAWIKAGTGDDKTDIVVIADFWQRLGGVFSRDRDISSNGFFVPFGGFDARSGNEPGRVQGRRLLPRMFFAPTGPTQFGRKVTLRCRIRPRTRPTSPFYKSPYAVNPNAYPGAPGIHESKCFNAPACTRPALSIRAVATTSSLTLPRSRRRCLRETGRCTTAPSPAIFATNT